ncbi:MAG: recombinase family protein [Planctomycetaceae bacterium]|nr:recombinase family protein [Planctomycetaceae bacterium]
MTVSEASQVAGVSIGTIRNWCKEGEIQTTRTLGGHRRISRSSLLEKLGLQAASKSSRKYVCVYLRVSSESQRREGSLDRQKERMVEFVKEKFGLAEDDCLVIRDVASAFGQRQGLMKMIDGILSGDIGTVAEFQDRLSRTGSEYQMLLHLMKQNGCELVFAEQTIKDESEHGYLVREVIDYMTVLANRVSSSKAAKLCRADVRDEVVERTKEIEKEGCGLYWAVKILREEGVTSTIKGEERLITYSVLRKRLLQEQVSYRKYPENPNRIPKVDSPVIERFIKERCVISKEETEWSDELYAAYVTWAEQQGKRPQPRRAFAENVKRLGYKTYRSTKSRRRWQGLKLLDAR